MRSEGTVSAEDRSNNCCKEEKETSTEKRGERRCQPWGSAGEAGSSEFNQAGQSLAGGCYTSPAAGSQNKGDEYTEDLSTESRIDAPAVGSAAGKRRRKIPNENGHKGK